MAVDTRRALVGQAEANPLLLIWQDTEIKSMAALGKPEVSECAVVDGVVAPAHPRMALSLGRHQRLLMQGCGRVRGRLQLDPLGKAQTIHGVRLPASDLPCARCVDRNRKRGVAGAVCVEEAAPVLVRADQQREPLADFRTIANIMHRHKGENVQEDVVTQRREAILRRMGRIHEVNRRERM